MIPFQSLNGLYTIESLNDIDQEETKDLVEQEVEQDSEEDNEQVEQVEQVEEVEQVEQVKQVKQEDEDSKESKCCFYIGCIILLAIVLYFIHKHYNKKSIPIINTDTESSLGFKYFSEDIEKLKYLS